MHPAPVTLSSNEGFPQIGDAIREAREEAGMTLRELALKVGSNRTTLNRIESGEQKLGVMELVRLAVAMDYEPLYLFSRATSPATQQ